MTLTKNLTLTDGCAASIANRMPGLRSLALPMNPHFTIAGIAHLPRSLRSLQLLKITLPLICPFKTPLQALQAIPPDCDLFVILGFSMSSLRTWATLALLPGLISDYDTC